MRELLKGQEIPGRSEGEEEETGEIGNKCNVTLIEMDAKIMHKKFEINRTIGFLLINPIKPGGGKFAPPRH